MFYWGFGVGQDESYFSGPVSGNGVGPHKCPQMQYTGLEDRDNIEIYEGDVVYIAGYGNCVVEFKYCQWVFNPVGPCCSIDYCDACEDIEGIVGNIHENPELLTNGR